MLELEVRASAVVEKIFEKYMYHEKKISFYFLKISFTPIILFQN